MRARAGVTLLEVAVALLLLAVGALALAAGIGGSERARRAALADALALAAAEGWLEAWRSGPWSAGPARGVEVRTWGSWSGRLEWELTPAGACLAEAAAVAETMGRRVELRTRRFREGEATCGP